MAEDQSNAQTLLQDTWDERGAINMSMTFEKVNETMLSQLLRDIKKMDAKFSQKYSGTKTIAISDKTCHMTVKNAFPITKTLLLL